MDESFDTSLYRFGMTPPPKPGGTPGDYAEALAQWFLEDTFFRDFVYRNPASKGGKGELADAVVLHEATAIFMQCKAQSGERPGPVWAKKALADALSQLGHSHRMLVRPHVTEVVSETLGPVPFAAEHYPDHIGLIIVDQKDVTPYVATDLVPDLNVQGFPVHVFSLTDFMHTAVRFDTPSDLLFYLAERHLLANDAQPTVHGESAFLEHLIEVFPERLRRFCPELSEASYERTVNAFIPQAKGDLRRSNAWTRSLVVDDIIAHLHEADSELSWNKGVGARDITLVAQRLGALTRPKRVHVGTQMLKAAVNASTDDPYWFHFPDPGSHTLFIFLYTAMPRDERVSFLQHLLMGAKAHMDYPCLVAVATNPIGAGRSYDVAMFEGDLSPEDTKRYRGMPNPCPRATGETGTA